MAHITVRTRQTKTGLKWTATEAVWSADKNTCKERVVEAIALQALGFSPNMTPDQARIHAKKLNALDAVKRKEQASKVKAAERVSDLLVVENSIVPEKMSRAFVDYMEQNWFGGEYNLRKQVLNWNIVQKVITKLKIQPHEYFKRQRDIYRYFQNNKYSKSYIEKLLKVLNLWGEYYSDESKTYFKKVPNPRGVILESIKDASDADGLGATPLTINVLDKMRLKLPDGQWEYLRATLWLGLRPSELDAIIKDNSKFKVKKQDNVQVLSVHQSKLTAIPKDRRWKHIPLFHPEMMKALEDISSGIVKKPLVKTLKKASVLDGIGLYSGRKGFTDLMLSLGQSLENISTWLGHASIERTWKHYKNKELIKFDPIKKFVSK